MMQDAIDAKADRADVASRFDMDITRPLLEGVLPQPVDDGDDMGVVRIDVATRTAHLDQLLEVALGRPAVAALGIAHRAGQAEELDHIACEIGRVGQHGAHLLAQQVLQFAHPVGDEGLGGRHHHGMGGDFNRQNPVPGRILAGHDLGHPRQIHLQRIDSHVFDVEPARQPSAQTIGIQQFSVVCRAEPTRRQRHDGMLGPRGHAIETQHEFRAFLIDETVGLQGRHELAQLQWTPRVPQIDPCLVIRLRASIRAGAGYGERFVHDTPG